MLLIQEIVLSWDKNQRGAECAKARRHFLPAYPLEKNLPSEEVILQHLHFDQRGGSLIDIARENWLNLEKSLPQPGCPYGRAHREQMRRIAQIRKHRVQLYHSVEDVNLTNLSIKPCRKGFEISFYYDQCRSGKPFRRGHNKDYNNKDSLLYRQDCLNETAFVLAPDQYGRILWNDRITVGETGEWYYRLHIYNILSVTDEGVEEDILVTKTPDYVYRQMTVV